MLAACAVCAAMRGRRWEHQGYLIEGIFRVTAAASTFKKQRELAEGGKWDKLDDMESVAQLIKVWFREVPGSIFGLEQARRIADGALSDGATEARKRTIWDATSGGQTAGATIGGVRSTRPRDPLAAALRPAPMRPKTRSARERLAAAAAPAVSGRAPAAPGPARPPRHHPSSIRSSRSHRLLPRSCAFRLRGT